MKFLLRINRTDLILLTLILPFTYPLWLSAVAGLYLKKKGQQNPVFNIAMGLLIGLYLFMTIYPIVVLVINQEGLNQHKETIIPLLLALVSLQFIACAYLSGLINSVKVEQSRAPRLIHNRLAAFALRLFVLFYWPIGMWLFQKEMNGMLGKG
jgi:hypothetical protein